MRASRLIFTATFLASAALAQQAAYPPEMKGAAVETYKTVGEAKLSLYIFNPPGPTSGNRAAIVFFFGGGWTSGTPGQFEQQCRYLAAKGMVAIAADYRVKSRNQSTITDSVSDAKSAILYVRKNSARLGIDPDRIAAGGGSAGGHIAAAAGLISGPEELQSRPNALVLFNPVVIMAPVANDDDLNQNSGAIVARGKQEADAVAISPWHHIAKGSPPTIIFHGKSDTTVPWVTVESFTKRMQAAGNRCELVSFEGQNHGFFNFRPTGNQYYDETVNKAGDFLASLGFIR